MNLAKRLLPLAGATFLSIIGLGILIPIITFYYIELGGEKADAPLIFSTFSAAALIAAPFWGRISDRFGRRPVLIASAAGTVASYIWLAYATELWELYASRVLAGLAAGWAAAAQAYVADITTENDRAKGMGMIGASVGLGFTIGPAIGAMSVGGDTPDYTTTLLISAGCAVAGLILTLITIPEPERLISNASGPSFNLGLLKKNKVARLLALYFAVYVVFTGIEGVLAIWLLDRFSLGARDFGYYLAFAGVVNVIIQGGIVGRLVKRLGEAVVVPIAVSAVALSLVAILVAETPTMIYLPMALLAIGMGLFGPAMQSLFSMAAPEGMKGAILGTGQSAMSFARILGPAGGALIFGTFGPEAPFMVCLCFAAVILVFSLTLRKRFPKKQDAAASKA